MLLRDLTEVWISEYKKINDHGEKTKEWTFKKLNTPNGTAFLNIQQDLNELDRKSTGETDYSILNARATVKYDIKKGDGISLTDISELSNFKPDYIVTDLPSIGNTILYKLEKNNGS